METVPSIPVASDELPRLPSSALGHLPGPRGSRLGGNLSDLLPDPGPFLRQCRRVHGDCFTVGLLRNSRVVILMGAQANKLVLLDSDDNFSSRRGWDVVLDYFGNNVLVRDFADHRQHRRILASMFKPADLAAQLKHMQPIIGAAVRGCRGTIDAYTMCKRLTLKIALETIAGIDTSDRAMQGYYQDLVAVLDGVMARHVPLPWSRYKRGVRARDRLRLRLHGQVEARRAAIVPDLFSRLAAFTDADGRALSAEDVVDHMFGMLFAAHDTTATTLALMLIRLADHPDWQQAIREEARHIRRDCNARQLPYDALKRMPVADAVFRETLRLHAPIQLIPRRSVGEFEFAGQRIPANAPILLVPQGTHLDPNHFPEPEDFRPQRFLNGEPEQPFGFVPFGRGSHMCLGMHFAAMEVKAVCFELLLRYELIPAGTDMRLEYLPIVRPRRPLKVGVQRIDRIGE